MKPVTPQPEHSSESTVEDESEPEEPDRAGLTEAHPVVFRMTEMACKWPGIAHKLEEMAELMTKSAEFRNRAQEILKDIMFTLPPEASPMSKTALNTYVHLTI